MRLHNVDVRKVSTPNFLKIWEGPVSERGQADVCWTLSVMTTTLNGKYKHLGSILPNIVGA